MTIQEAVKAARRNQPVMYDNPMEGPMLFARIGCVRKDFALLADAARGKEAEYYSLELLPMAGGSVEVVSPELVRIATAEELKDIRHYKRAQEMPEIHPELLCEEVKRGRPWADRKEG